MVIVEPGRPADSTMRGVPILTYEDYLWPINKPAVNVGVNEMNVSDPFSTFHIHLPAEDFKYSQARLICFLVRLQVAHKDSQSRERKLHNCKYLLCDCTTTSNLILCVVPIEETWTWSRE